MSVIDENDLTLKEPKKICTIQQENVGLFKLESILEAGLVHIVNSADNSKVLIACNAGTNNLLTFIMDNDLNILKQTVVKTATQGFDIKSAIVTNDNLECLVLKSDKETKIVFNGRKTFYSNWCFLDIK
jgi:hypothetical protein